MAYLKQAWLVLALALVFGGLLAGVQTWLGGQIEDNKRNETYGEIPNLVGADPASVAEVRERTTDDGKVAYQPVDADGEPLGWVIKGAGQGFAGPIEVLIGLDAPAERITGLFVLAQTETPALGDNIKTAAFRDQFQGLWATAPIEVGRAGAAETPATSSASTKDNAIQSLSGATISSTAVTTIVNKAVEEFRHRKDELTQ